MEDMMRQSAADVEEMPGVEERLEAGRPVIRREDMVQSASVMLENSGLADIPGAHAAASSLQRIATIAQADQGQLRTSEYLAIADAYSAVRVDCQRLLEAMPRQQQDESKQRVAPSSFSMKADATPEPVPEPIGAANAIAGLVWVGLVAWSFTAAPGPFPDPIGPQLVATLAAQPAPRPESINELFYAVFNSFSVVAASIAALTLPSGGKLEAEKLQAAPTALASWIPAGQRVPAIPFLWGSVDRLLCAWAVLRLAIRAPGPTRRRRVVHAQYLRAARVWRRPLRIDSLAAILLRPAVTGAGLRGGGGRF